MFKQINYSQNEYEYEFVSVSIDELVPDDH